MNIRLVVASADTDCQDLMRSLLSAALQLVPLSVHNAQARSRDELAGRAAARLDDIVLLDWQLAGADTPLLVRELRQANPQLRIIALLPQQLRQYRQYLWQAGACASIPKEHLDQEWLSSVLCLVQRAMERQAQLDLQPA